MTKKLIYLNGILTAVLGINVLIAVYIPHIDESRFWMLSGALFCNSLSTFIQTALTMCDIWDDEQKREAVWQCNKSEQPALTDSERIYGDE